MKDSLYKMSLVVIICFLFGLCNGISSPVAVVFTFFILLLNTNRHTAGFFLLMYGGVWGGAVRSLYPIIPLYGLLLNIIGIYLVRDLIGKVLFRHKSSLIAMSLTFVVFCIAYFIGPRTAFASTKLLNIFQNGIFFLCAYLTLSNSRQISIRDVAILLLFTSVFLISYAVNIYQISPSSLVDFNWFRQGLQAYRYRTGDDLLVDYQEVGMNATYAFALLLSLKEKPKDLYVLSAIAIFLTLISGARQSLLACVVVVFFRYAYFNNVRSLKKILLLFFAVALVFCVYSVLLTSNIEAVTSTLESGDEERNFIWLLSLKLFYDSPMYGLGLGGFAPYSPDNPWSHNIILEILCECGVFGFVSLFLIVIDYWINQRVKIKQLSHTQFYYFLALIPLLVRIMVSADFRLSIAIFCAIFAISNTKKTIKS